MRSILRSNSWKTKTTVCWGKRDRWLSFDGVEDFFGSLNQKIVELPMVCHENQLFSSLIIFMTVCAWGSVVRVVCIRTHGCARTTNAFPGFISSFFFVSYYVFMLFCAMTCAGRAPCAGGPWWRIRQYDQKYTEVMLLESLLTLSLGFILLYIPYEQTLVRLYIVRARRIQMYSYEF